MKWLMKAGFGGYLNWVWVAGAAALALLIFAAVKIADARHENTIAVAEKAGAATAVAKGQQQTLEELVEAKDAADEILNDVGFARYCGCLRGAAKGFESSCARELDVPDDAGAAAQACTAQGR